jgi:ketosteroid isomerase-like protein
MRARLAWGLGILAVAAVTWWLFPTEERRVRSRLGELSQSASIPANEQDLGRVARLGRLRRLLTDDVVLEAGAPVGPVVGGDSLVGIAAQFRYGDGGLRVELHDLVVVVADDERSARAQARVVATERAADRRETVDMRDVSLELSKTDGGWQLTRVVVAPEGQATGR